MPKFGTTSSEGVRAITTVQLGYNSAGKGPWFSRPSTGGPDPKSYLSKLCGGTYAVAVQSMPAFMNLRRCTCPPQTQNWKHRTEPRFRFISFAFFYFLSLPLSIVSNSGSAEPEFNPCERQGRFSVWKSQAEAQIE